MLPKELLQTNSAQASVLCAAVRLVERISYKTTGTPLSAACQAASDPANPAPIMVRKSFTKNYQAASLVFLNPHSGQRVEGSSFFFHFWTSTCIPLSRVHGLPHVRCLQLRVLRRPHTTWAAHKLTLSTLHAPHDKTDHHFNAHTTATHH